MQKFENVLLWIINSSTPHYYIVVSVVKRIKSSFCGREFMPMLNVGYREYFESRVFLEPQGWEICLGF